MEGYSITTMLCPHSISRVLSLNPLFLQALFFAVFTPHYVLNAQ
ncbi:hypothetical protein UY3_13112 [Acetobacter orientalis]|uniref:Uncharacterized protein n=1 Tax=Acetobacter orientalis TaxID=146474 RepID=A0A2Z5ZIU9_9PROT|nr:hypothetical protein UY3_13112 [Acetobacter orientalis]